MRRRVSVALIVASMVAAGCGLLPSPPADDRCHPNGALSCTTVGGVPLGELSRSWGVDAPPCKRDCERPIEVAWANVELRAPGHPAVTSIDEYGPDRHAVCGDALCDWTGYFGIFVFMFDDSTMLPIIVRCPLTHCLVVESYGSP
jgi:hypothetical protein